MKLALSILLLSAALAWAPPPGGSGGSPARRSNLTPPSGGGGGCTTQQDGLTGTTASITTDSGVYIATRFVAGASYTVCKGTMYLKRTGTLDGTWNMQLWSHNSGANTPNAVIDASDSDPTIGTTAADITFNNLAASLTSGTVYWVILFHSTGGDFSGITIDTHEGAIASGRYMISNNGTAWTEVDTGKGSVFRLYQ